MRIKTLRVLLVDDNEISRIVTGVMLNEGGCQNVAEAQSGAQAIDFLKRDEFDLVLCDVHMPDMNGLSVLHYIRTTEGLRHLRVLMVSAADAEEVSWGEADGYIVKPFKWETLRRNIEALPE